MNGGVVLIFLVVFLVRIPLHPSPQSMNGIKRAGEGGFSVRSNDGGNSTIKLTRGKSTKLLLASTIDWTLGTLK